MVINIVDETQTATATIRYVEFYSAKGNKKEWYYITIPKRLKWKQGDLVKFKRVYINE